MSFLTGPCSRGLNSETIDAIWENLDFIGGRPHDLSLVFAALVARDRRDDRFGTAVVDRGGQPVERLFSIEVLCQRKTPPSRVIPEGRSVWPTSRAALLNRTRKLAFSSSCLLQERASEAGGRPSGKRSYGITRSRAETESRNQFSTIVRYSACMGTQPADKAKRALRRRQPLLAAWLDALDRHDDPARRCASKSQQTQWPRREISVIRWTRPTDFGCRQGCMPVGRVPGHADQHAGLLPKSCRRHDEPSQRLRGHHSVTVEAGRGLRYRGRTF
jgi:hypothetical protein